MSIESEQDDFNRADKVIHKVEDQWHYPVMQKYGWISDTPTGIGFVRSYDYHHPSISIPNKITVTTGVHADTWLTGSGEGGYWASLEPYLKKLSQNIDEVNKN